MCHTYALTLDFPQVDHNKEDHVSSTDNQSKLHKHNDEEQFIVVRVLTRPPAAGLDFSHDSEKSAAASQTLL